MTANVQHYGCWKFAGRLLDRVNTPWITLSSHWFCFYNFRLQSCVIKQQTTDGIVYVVWVITTVPHCLEWYKVYSHIRSSSAVFGTYTVVRLVTLGCTCGVIIIVYYANKAASKVPHTLSGKK